jgi:hypothetical protein
MRAKRRTRRPNSTMGVTTSGTPASTSRVSLRLVVNSMTKPPIRISRLRSAIERLEPTAFSISVVSEVRREITAPVRPASKYEGGRLSRWSKTLRRRSAVTRSPSQETL